jgi:hypothetical protein
MDDTEGLQNPPLSLWVPPPRKRRHVDPKAEAESWLGGFVTGSRECALSGSAMLSKDAAIEAEHAVIAAPTSDRSRTFQRPGLLFNAAG